MTTRRSVLRAGGIGLLVAHRLSHGQPAATTRHVGMISSASEAAGAHLRAAFRQGMRDLGWVEGKDVEYRFMYADGHTERLDSLAGELIGQKFDVIVAASTSATRAAQRAWGLCSQAISVTESRSASSSAPGSTFQMRRAAGSVPAANRRPS